MTGDNIKSLDARLSRRYMGRLAALSAVSALPNSVVADDDASLLKITSPLPRQVFQRSGYIAKHSHEHAPGGARLGHAEVPVRGQWLFDKPAQLEARAILQAGCTGHSTEWASLGKVEPRANFNYSCRIPAGGWYRLEVRAMSDDGRQLTEAKVDPFGVGELFLIAGQSYAAGANDEHQKIDDPLGRSVLYDWVKKAWRTANDPFPHVDTGGTIWPAFANLLQPMLRVPVGLINVAVGGTASRQWMPGEALHQRILEGGQAIGRFRFVLWQQGESDVIENIDTKVYVDRLITIRKSLCQRWGFEPRWLLAKSTVHPTVYKKPVQENQIREAIDQLWQKPGFGHGPDTDILTGENRGGIKSRRHFSPIGQRRAGAMWFASVWPALNQEAEA